MREGAGYSVVPAPASRLNPWCAKHRLSSSDTAQASVDLRLYQSPNVNVEGGGIVPLSGAMVPNLHLSVSYSDIRFSCPTLVAPSLRKSRPLLETFTLTRAGTI